MKPRPIDVCKLCLKPQKLHSSHIIPEFMYLDMYDEKHRSLKIGSDFNSRERFMQKGEREYLLCEKCEAHLSEFESYAAPTIKSLSNLNVEHTDEYYFVKDVDYRIFKLFQMSLLWRASVASTAMFRNIRLGDFEDQLRSMILASDPGKPNEYGCLILIMENTKYLHRIIWSPETDHVDGCTTYRFQIGRLFWYFFLPGCVPSSATKYFLDEANLLHVPTVSWSEEIVVQRLAGRLAQSKVRK